MFGLSLFQVLAASTEGAFANLELSKRWDLLWLPLLGGASSLLQKAPGLTFENRIVFFCLVHSSLSASLCSSQSGSLEVFQIITLYASGKREKKHS